MKNKFTTTQILGIEKQLSCPEGVKGVELGHKMHASNIGMTMAAINALQIEDENIVLELGHGNCHHLKEITGKATRIKYYGLEISETMQQEAIAFNMNSNASFELYDGINIPHEDYFFDRIITVNTIYFWANPKGLLQEISRVLKPNGLVSIAFADKEFMKELPFVGERFTLYDLEAIKELITSTNLEIDRVQNKEEEVTNKVGELVHRAFKVVVLKKS
ncbi:class I SAM-dependent methyltransferase [Tenacibaculum amylolyticum]|uniref:class I SAM-dependent methyltransferase n=1 Tax=Tenacibaculum amylolyticum TaxID=104269 RepID=UPI00389649DF